MSHNGKEGRDGAQTGGKQNEKWQLFLWVDGYVMES